MRPHLVPALITAAACTLPLSAKAAPPQIVQAYVENLVRQCGGETTPALAAQVVEHIDLNGDKIDDWVVDGSRVPCPGRPAAFADDGALLTIFLGSADGRAHPALQRAVFGSHLERRPDAGFALYLTLAGRDCELNDNKARCDRKVEWRSEPRRLDLAPLAPALKGAAKPAR